MYPYENILGKMHRSRSNGKWMHGDAELINIRMCYLHDTALLNCNICKGPKKLQEPNDKKL